MPFVNSYTGSLALIFCGGCLDPNGPCVGEVDKEKHSFHSRPDAVTSATHGLGGFD